MTQDTFDIAWPEPARRKGREGERKTREAKGAKGVRYERVRTVDRPKCSECVRLMQEGGNWHAPNPVVYVRRSPEGDLWLCYLHLQGQREKDGMAPIKIKPDDGL